MNEDTLLSFLMQLIAENPKTSVAVTVGLFLFLKIPKRQGPSQAAVDSQIKAKQDEFNNAVKQATEGIKDAKIKYDAAKRDYESDRDGRAD